MATTHPWFPLFVTDWLLDPEVQQLEWDERGIYIDLLCGQWKDGGLPADPENVRRTLRGHVSKKLWRARVWAALEKFFPLGADNIRRNPRLEVEREKLGAASQKQRAKAAARWAAPQNQEVTLPSGHASFLKPASQKTGDISSNQSESHGPTYAAASAPAIPQQSRGNAISEITEDLKEDLKDLSATADPSSVLQIDFFRKTAKPEPLAAKTARRPKRAEDPLPFSIREAMDAIASTAEPRVWNNCDVAQELNPNLSKLIRKDAPHGLEDFKRFGRMLALGHYRVWDGSEPRGPLWLASNKGKEAFQYCVNSWDGGPPQREKPLASQRRAAAHAVMHPDDIADPLR